MRKSRISAFASVATGALLALAGAAGGTPCSPASSNIVSTYKPFQVPHAAPDYPTGVSIPTNMRVVEVLTSLEICKNNAECTAADISTTRSTSSGASTKQSDNRAVPDLVHWWGTPVDQGQLPFNPTTVGVSSTSVSEGTAASYWASPLTMPVVPVKATAGHDTRFHDDSEGNDQQRSRSRQRPPFPPNQFLARFYIVLQYLADVIKADEVCVFLFGVWAQHYYQRICNNRAGHTRRGSLRRWSWFALRMFLGLRNTFPLNRAASSTVQKDQGETDTECPSAADVDMMPPMGDSVATSSPARDTAIGLTADNAGDATTQHASQRFIGWEKIGRDAYYAHSYEAQMANTDHIQDFHSFQRKARVFMAGFPLVWVSSEVLGTKCLGDWRVVGECQCEEPQLDFFSPVKKPIQWSGRTDGE